MRRQKITSMSVIVLSLPHCVHVVGRDLPGQHEAQQDRYALGDLVLSRHPFAGGAGIGVDQPSRSLLGEAEAVDSLLELNRRHCCSDAASALTGCKTASRLVV